MKRKNGFYLIGEIHRTLYCFKGPAGFFNKPADLIPGFLTFFDNLLFRLFYILGPCGVENMFRSAKTKPSPKFAPDSDLRSVVDSLVFLPCRFVQEFADTVCVAQTMYINLA